jgi:hypothetical protein
MREKKAMADGMRCADVYTNRVRVLRVLVEQKINFMNNYSFIQLRLYNN